MAKESDNETNTELSPLFPSVLSSHTSLQTPQSGEDPIGLLVYMAERGEIDPWDVDIVLIIDRFFSEAERQRAFDIRVSGRMLFYAATLLRIKAEYFDDESVDHEDESLEEFWEGEDSSNIVRREPGRGDPISFLEQEISRRLHRKHVRKQPVSVYMLINLLRNAEKEERRRQRESYQSYDMYVSADDVSDLVAHEEAYQEFTTQVLSCCHELIEQDEPITLSGLANELDVSRHLVFISLLFLTYDGFISLDQAEFFGEIIITCSDFSLL
ncbi:MAG: segregation/condensation protein A [Methanomicrobiales archaeon]|nr:segregation/condensation protein A [Methanomicrobiales archaeon]